MDHPPLAAVHGAEPERNARSLNPLRGRGRAHAQLLNTQQPVIIRIERQARMVLAWDTQGFHRDVFQSQQKLCPIAQQQIHIRTAKLHHHVRIFYLWIGRMARKNLES